jgi:membrane protein implicated in regulation of membrane protease activity
MTKIVVAIGWIYVVLMMAVAEALSSQGSVLGAFFTLLLYGVLPLAIVLYIMGTPARRRALRDAEAREIVGRAGAGERGVASVPPDGGGHAPGDAVATEREER